jgi:glycosyltransferase involved in cell wall biosynthesis
MVFTGRLVEQKDPFTVLNAIKIVSEKQKDFILHIMGDGVLRKGMEEFVKENDLYDNVKFFGWVSKEQMVKEYQSAHVNVIASVFEGMSIGVFESLACGCFLITTPIDDIEHIITPNENAVLVNFYSPKEMAEQIEKYYNEKYLKNYVVPEKLIIDLKKEFDWNHRVEEYQSVFKKIIGK